MPIHFSLNYVIWLLNMEARGSLRNMSMCSIVLALLVLDDGSVWGIIGYGRFIPGGDPPSQSELVDLVLLFRDVF